jgi:hypothetical protein
MASPGQLVETIASALGVPRQTVIQHDRQLAAKGYRRKGGRGRSAIRVTTEDAASLLIAVAAAPVSGPVVKETVGTFEKYASLPAWKLHHYEPGNWSGLKVLSELPKGHSFSEALATLIREYARGNFASVDFVWSNFPGAESGDPGDVQVTVTLEGPIPTAGIKIIGHRSEPKLEVKDAELSYQPKISPARAKGGLTVSHRGDLVQMRAFTDYTLKAVAALFVDKVSTQEKV